MRRLMFTAYFTLFSFLRVISMFGRHPLVEAAARQRKRLQEALPFLAVDAKDWDPLTDPENRVKVCVNFIFCKNWNDFNIYYDNISPDIYAL